MNLDQFINSVLVSVLSGIKRAQEDAIIGAYVVPGGDGGHQYPQNARVSYNAKIKSTIIDFDVAITVETSDKANGGGGLKIAGMGAKLKGESVTRDARVSRIQFGVPIMLPENQKNWFEELE